MLEIRPVVIVGIGPQSQKTVQQYIRLVSERRGEVPALLPAVIHYSSREMSLKQERDGIQQIALSCPVFDAESDWPLWLPPELRSLSPAQRDGTRAWMRAALLQRADDLQELWLEQIPRLLSFVTLERLAEQGLQLAGNSEIDIHVLADLGDPLGSGILADLICLIVSVCRQVGLSPLVSALLYLPSATSPAPIEEAIAYAALKELEYYAGGHSYAGAFVPQELGSGGPVLLNNGCYLLDTVNEAGYTLQDEEQLIATACEQLYAMTFLNLESAVREHREQRYQRATLRGKARVYESFGMAIRYVPRRTLSAWAVARLGGDLVRSVVDERVEVDGEQRTRAFIERVGLRVEALESALRQTDVTQRVEKMLASLLQTGVKQLESRSRAILQTIREQYLPLLNARVKEKGEEEIEHIQEAVSEEIQMTLEDLPVGGVGVALSLLDRLSDDLCELEARVQEQVRHHHSELSRSLGTVSETYYALRNVTMSTPPWPVALFSAVGVLILPILYLILLIYRVILPQSALWALGVSGILAAGVLTVSGFVIFRLVQQGRVLARQHAHMVRERFHLESDPLLQREMSNIYTVAQSTVARARSDVEALAAQLQAVGARFEREEKAHADRLQALTVPGPSRSVVDTGIAAYFYEASTPDRQRLLSALLDSSGQVSHWLGRCVESADSFGLWLHDQVARFGAQCLEPSVDRFTLNEALTSNGTRIEPVLERLFERAYPLWNYDPRFLSRAKTQRMTFVGANTQADGWPRLAGVVAEAEPEIILHHTGDPSALIVMTVHQGVPLFALRRIGQYRNHYAEALWRGKLPIHTTNSLVLADDLIPMRRRMRVGPATLFSTGLALDVIRRDPDGRYVAPREEGKTIRLSAQKERAVALMGMDGPTCREVQRRLDALVAREGPEAIEARLDEYTTDVPGLEDWEVKGIVEFGRAQEPVRPPPKPQKAQEPMLPPPKPEKAQEPMLPPPKPEKAQEGVAGGTRPLSTAKGP
jgi:hypothetical protein